MSSTSYHPLPRSESNERLPQRLTHLDSDEFEPPRKSSVFTLRRILFVVFFIVVAFVFYKAGQFSVQPHGPTSEPPKAPQAPQNPLPEKDRPCSGENSTMPCDGKYSVGYFVNWGIYGRKFPPALIPAKDLTHILYAFANVKPDNGEVYLSDLWADQDIHYPGDSWNDVGTNLYGNFKAVYNLKKEHRHLKVLLSIGGWTYSPSFHPVVVNPVLRAKFVESSIKLVEDYGLDGLDVDYEYPTNNDQALGYVSLLAEMREALDKQATKKGSGCKFLLTIAAPCGPDNYNKLHVAAMDKSLDFWNLMAYDFSGSWDSVANHQANIYGGPVSASASVDYYISKGVKREKLVLGIPLYGRSFLNTEGPGTSYSGLGPGTWENGVYDYRVLPLPGSTVHVDKKATGSWSYDSTKKEMISFDSEEVAKLKGQYIKKEGLGGSMFWELSGDKGSAREGMETGPGKDPQSGNSLVAIVKNVMGGLETSENWLEYTNSKFDNLKKGMV